MNPFSKPPSKYFWNPRPLIETAWRTAIPFKIYAEGIEVKEIIRWHELRRSKEVAGQKEPKRAT